MAAPNLKMPNVRQKRAPRYTPVSKRQDKPDAVCWLIRNHPEFTDSDIIKLIGTTKATIAKIRERSHWNAANIKAVDPVTWACARSWNWIWPLPAPASGSSAPRSAPPRRAQRLKTIAETTGPGVNCRAREELSEGAPAPDEYKLSSELEQD